MTHNSTINAQFVEVLLLNAKDQIVRMTQTDENGDFTFEKIDPTLDYKLLINEDDAKVSFLGDNVTSSSEVSLEGVIYSFKDKEKSIKAEMKIYLADSKRTISNTIQSAPSGKFK